MKLLGLLLLTACAIAQPQVDSVYVFDDLSGLFTNAVSLPDGGYIIGGLLIEDGIQHRAVLRLSPEREVVWQRGVRSDISYDFTALLVDNERVLVVTTEMVPIDTLGEAPRSIAILYSLDGDSLWAQDFEDEVNFTGLRCAASDGGSGYFLLGTEMVLNGEFFNQDVRLLHVDSAGTLLSVDYFGGESQDNPLGLVKLEGDTLVMAMALVRSGRIEVNMLWLSSAGDSLGGRVYEDDSEMYPSEQSGLSRRGSRWDLYWLGHLPDVEGDVLRWYRLEENGDLISAITVVGPVNSIQNVTQSPDGLLTVGFSPWGMLENRNAVICRVNLNGLWYYRHELELPQLQEGYGFLPLPSGAVALLGRTADEDWNTWPCIFYLSESFSTSYLLSIPPYVDFGAIPQNEVSVREIALFTSGDSSVTIESFVNPEFLTVNLALPVTINTGETLRFEAGFRAEELTIYEDTLRIFSDAGNSELTIPVRGAALYPECTPALGTVNFFWTEVGDTVRRPLALLNTGTLPLTIEPLTVRVPFHLDSVGPFVAAPDSTALLWFEFRPVATGDFRDTLLIFSDDPHSPDTVILLGRGLPAHIDADEPAELPREFRFHAAYPNPFNATAMLAFELPRAQTVTLELFDVNGRLTHTLLHAPCAAGRHSVPLRGDDLASGVYFAALRTPDFQGVQKVVLLK